MSKPQQWEHALQLAQQALSESNAGLKRRHERITELEEANRNLQTSLREMTEQHAQWRAGLEQQVRDLRTTNHRRLCGCEESAGVLGCAVGCACRCHRLEAQVAAMREALLVALDWIPEPDHHESDCPGDCEGHASKWMIGRALSAVAGTDWEQRIRAEERRRLVAGDEGHGHWAGVLPDDPVALRKFIRDVADEARAQERERCAKVAEEFTELTVGALTAAAIRALRDT